MTSEEALYIVVRHRDQPDQPWGNAWDDERRLIAITTTTDLGAKLEAARARRTPIFVHRCGWGGADPTICCEVQVTKLDRIGGKQVLVTFDCIRTLSARPPTAPRPGDHSYVGLQPAADA